MNEKQQELAIQLLTEIVDDLGDKSKLTLWEKMIFENAKKILNNDC